MHTLLLQQTRNMNLRTQVARDRYCYSWKDT